VAQPWGARPAARWAATGDGRLGAVPAVRGAIALSFLGELPAAALEQLLATAVLYERPAGMALGLTRREAGATTATALVVSGLVRLFLTSPRGRQVTVRYGRPGAVVGMTHLASGHPAPDTEAVTHSRLLGLRADVLQELSRSDPRVGWPVAREVCEQLNEMLQEFEANAFGSVRQRVARHLVDLASERHNGRSLIAVVTQQQLADAVGSVREVVARAIHELGAEGLVESRPEGIRVTDPAALRAAAGSGLRSLLTAPRRRLRSQGLPT
jgi:CRP/FNR family cyclic AMP-dependent transcriptional regulator